MIDYHEPLFEGHAPTADRCRRVLMNCIPIPSPCSPRQINPPISLLSQLLIPRAQHQKTENYSSHVIPLVLVLTLSSSSSPSWSPLLVNPCVSGALRERTRVTPTPNTKHRTSAVSAGGLRQPASDASDPPDRPGPALATDQQAPILFQGADRLLELGALDLDTRALTHALEQLGVPDAAAGADVVVIIHDPQHRALQFVTAPSLHGAATLAEQAHVDEARAGIGRAGFDGRFDQADRFGDVALLDGLGQAHLGVRLAQADHGLELPCRRGDAPLRALDVRALVAHRNVRVRQGRGGRGGERWVDVAARVGDVRGQELDGLGGG